MPVITSPIHQQETDSTYHIKFKRLSLKGGADIRDDQDLRVYQIRGEATRLGRTFHLIDQTGVLLYTIQKKPTGLSQTINIYHSNEIVAVIRCLSSRSIIPINILGRENLRAVVGVKTFEYRIFRLGEEIAYISRNKLRLGDDYEVHINPGEQQSLMLSIVLALSVIYRYSLLGDQGLSKQKAPLNPIPWRDELEIRNETSLSFSIPDQHPYLVTHPI